MKKSENCANWNDFQTFLETNVEDQRENFENIARYWLHLHNNNVCNEFNFLRHFQVR